MIDLESYTLQTLTENLTLCVKQEVMDLHAVRSVITCFVHKVGNGETHQNDKYKIYVTADTNNLLHFYTFQTILNTICLSFY